VQRLSKTLSFTPFQQFAAKAYVDCSDVTVDLHGNPEFMRDLDQAVRAALTPGPHLDYQNLRTANSLKNFFEDILEKSSSTDPVQVRLFEWTKHVITLAASDGIYGHSNPFLKKKYEDAFW
jgi:hypothetical protein